MTLPTTTTPSLYQALTQVLGLSARTKNLSQASLASLQQGPVSSDWIFEFLTSANIIIVNLNLYKNTAGLNTYAQAQVPGYVGTMTTDITAVVNAIQACIDWVIANFPKDSTNGFLLAYTTLAANGSRTPRMFSSVQTAGLQTNLTSLIELIS